jgi:ABC-type branched-subunit amino acid transport system substrate-binding protein
MTYILALTIFFVGLVSSMSSLAQDKISIGVVAPLTGSASSRGVEFVVGARSAIDMVNGKGGVNGKMIELHVEDGQCDPGLHAMRSRDLVVQMKSRVVVELACGASSASASMELKRLGVPHLALMQSGSVTHSGLIGQGGVANADSTTLEALNKVLGKKSASLSESSLKGYIAVEVATQAIGMARSEAGTSIVTSLQDKSFSTAAGRLKFDAIPGRKAGEGSTFNVDLWTSQKDCPVCPKSGECPQSVQRLIAAKPTCNKK